MTCHRFASGIICINPWGRLHLGNRYITVDFHEYCGPSFAYADGSIYDPKDENDPIWPIFQAWLEKYRAKKNRSDNAKKKVRP